MKTRQITPQEALDRLMAQCAAAEHCSHEVLLKMHRWQLPSNEAAGVLARLKELRYIDDARFARAFVSDKVRFERRGKLYIRRALMAKRIDGSLIAEALSEVDETLYFENLRTTLRSKMRLSPDLATTFEGRTKLFRYAVGRGYESSLVSTVLRELLQS